MRVVLDLAPPLDEQPLAPSRWTQLAGELESLLSPLSRQPDVGLRTMFGAAGVIVAIYDSTPARPDTLTRTRESVEELIQDTEFERWSIVGATCDD